MEKSTLSGSALSDSWLDEYAKLSTAERMDPLLSLTTMTSTGCLPCKQRAGGPRQGILAAGEPVTGPRWSGVIGVEGELTGDGRLIEVNALRWENLPLPLRYVGSDVGSHDGAQVVGRITSISRAANGEILAEGEFDGTSTVALEAMRQVGENLTNGISMDLDDVSFEIRVAKELMDDGMGGMPLLLAAEDEQPAEPAVDADGRVKVMEINADDEVRVTTSGRIRAATIVAIPAFATAQIHLAGGDDETLADAQPGDSDPPAEVPTVGLLPDGETECSCVEDDPAFDPDCDCTQVPEDESGGLDAEPPTKQSADALIAAAAPMEPPVSWFSDPKFSDYHPLKVTPEGQVYGHIAQWGACHLSHASHGQCVSPPHSATGYAHFHYGAVLTQEGSEVAVGHLTLDTRHAGGDLSPAATLSHYEDTGTVIADVRAGEDAWGIWVAGAIRPTATAAQVRALRAAPISGDWRRIGGNLELVAALAVNVPGFGIPRPAGLVAGGVVQSLVAAGMLPPRLIKQPGTKGSLSDDDLMYLKRLADRERREEQTLLASGRRDSATELARRVRASALAMRVHHPLVSRSAN